MQLVRTLHLLKIRGLQMKRFFGWKVLFFLVATGWAQNPNLDHGLKGREQRPEAGTCTIVAPGPDNGMHKTSQRGEIIIGCPKIWRSERLFMTLDGLMRDVDSITIAGLQGLDPNAANNAEITQIVNAFNASVKFDQTAAINNKFAIEKSTRQRDSDLQNFQFAQQNAQRDQDYRKSLYDRRDALLTNLNLLQDHENDLRKSKASTDDLKAVRDQEDAVTKQLGDIKTEISNAPTAGTPEIQDQKAPPGTQADQPPTKSLLGDLPDAMKNAIVSKLTAPTFPPALQMDNTIELLHQRIARELAVMHDDLIRETGTYTVYLAQFDVSLVPKHAAKGRIAKLDIRILDEDNRTLAYELYPGASSYNIMRGMDKTTHVGLTGAAETVAGLGANASFSHDKQQMRSGMSQSLYVSGFGAGTANFGWLFGPAPFENYVAPGIRTVHVVFAVRRSSLGENTLHSIKLEARHCWLKQEKRYFSRFSRQEADECEGGADPIKIDLRVPESDNETLNIQSVSYVPVPLKSSASPAPQPGNQPAPPPTGTIEIRFTKEIDPNLTITAGDHLLRRVRDVRGRGLYLGEAAKSNLQAPQTKPVP